MRHKSVCLVTEDNFWKLIIDINFKQLGFNKKGAISSDKLNLTVWVCPN